ncbi:MAG TPA: ATP-dependent helicase [Acidimicrobiales bacterium]|nr:ATP-dependent helicase [Acidimicrobiales bacterium]
MARIVTPSDMTGRLLAGCDAEQREAITTPARPLCVLAAAGSGKTRVLTRRIAWRVNEGSASAPYVLALTFTRKAASELRGRLSSLGLAEEATAGTFHAVAFGELRRLAAERQRPAPVVIASKARLLAAAAGHDVAHDRTALADLAAEIEWAQARCLSARDYTRAVTAGGRRSQSDPEVVTEVWKRYEREKRRRGVLDFEDLLVRCASELEDDPDFAASARWRLRHLFVDEYQDVNPAQVRLLDAWLGDSDDLCVVGDPDQAIYSWNGSDPRALVEFPLRYPGARVVRLAMNYRSTDTVLAVASSVLGAATVPAGPAPPARGHQAGEPGRELGEVLVSGRPRQSRAVQPIVAYDTDIDEARGVVAALRRARSPGAPWSSLAILARTNAQLVAFERQLDEADVPFRSGGGRAFLARPSVRSALDSLTSRSEVPGFHAWMEELTASGAPPPAGGDDSELDRAGLGPVDDDLAELARLALEYLRSDPSPGANGFVTWLEASLRADPPRQSGDAVDLMTFHRAKGLEWRVVFVTGLEDGLVPIAHARSPEAAAEERRLLYVACTRAMDDLYCSWARQRVFGARRSARTPSPFLAAIEATHRELARLAEVTPEHLTASRREVRSLLAGREPTRRDS